jgi:hypothetical protein
MLRLAPAGETAFAEWVVTPVRHGRDFRLEFLAKLYFAEREGPVAVADLIARQRAECERWLSRLRAQTDELDAGQRFDRLVLGFRRSQIAALVAWLDECAAAPVGGTPLPSQPST